MRQLYLFLTTDDRARWRSCAIAMLLGSICGVALEKSGQSFDFSAVVVVVVIGIVFTTQTGWYCRATARREASAPSMVDRRSVLKWGTIAAGLLIADVFGAPKVEAQIVNGRLRVLAKTNPLTPEAADQVTANLSVANEWGISVPYSTLVQLRNSIKSSISEGSLQSLAKSANALTAYAEWRVVQANDPDIAEVTRLAEETADAALAENAHKLQSCFEALTRLIADPRVSALARARALVFRAMIKVFILDNKGALADIREAERLGSLDLPDICLIEATYLSAQNNVGDLTLAVKMTSFALYLDSTQISSPELYKASVLGARIMAYVRLADYEHAAADAERIILAGSPAPSSLKLAYEVLILSFLGEGRYDSALNAAMEYRSQIGGAVAERWAETITSHPNDAAYLFKLLSPEELGSGGQVKPSP
jgi:hypothetical protein